MGGELEAGRLAHQIQTVRRRVLDPRHISRSALLTGCLYKSPEVLQILEAAGLDRGVWFRLLALNSADLDNLTGFKAKVEPENTVDEAMLGDALELYGRHFPGRPLDSAGLAWSIVSKPERGFVGKRLAEAHLDFDIARELLLEVLRASDGGETRRGEEAPQDYLIPIDRFEDVSMSSFVRVVFTSAAQTARDRGGGVLTSSMVLLSLVEAGGNDPEQDDNIGAFLFKTLYRPAPERYKAVLDEYLSWYGQQPRSGRSSASQLSGISALTPYLWGAIGEAQRISDQVSAGEARVHARHLLAGLLSFRPTAGEATGTQQILDRLGVPSSRVARNLLSYLIDNAPGEGADDLDAWRAILLAVGEEGTPAERGFVLPRFDAEGLEGHDLLGIDKDVASFARLLAARSLEPPLAVGLFGDWGTGKSFFMKRLQRRIETLAALVRGADETGQGSAFHRDVVQVEFNAWHYVETNLWASLEAEGTLLPPVSELKPWLSRVSRYSFRLGARPLG